LRNVQGLAFSADKQLLLVAEATARSVAVFQAQPVDGKLLPVAAIPVGLVPSRLSLSHSRLLVAGHVQAVRAALLGHHKFPVDSYVAILPNLNIEQCSSGANPNDIPEAKTFFDLKRSSATASLFATVNTLVIGMESNGIRVCFSI
jgi:hypothetical protein